MKKNMTFRSRFALYLFGLLPCAFISCLDPVPNLEELDKSKDVAVSVRGPNKKQNGFGFLVGEILPYTITLKYPKYVDSLIADFGEEGTKDNIQSSTKFEQKLSSIQVVFMISYQKPGVKKIKFTAKLHGSDKTKRADTLVTIGLEPKIVNKEIHSTPLQCIAEAPCTLWIETFPDDVQTQIRWIKNYVLLQNQTNKKICIPQLTKNDEGSYLCIIQNEFGIDSSKAFALIIAQNSTPSIIAHPVAVSTTIGKKVSFSCIAIPADVKYQWYKNGQVIDGAINSVYEIMAVTKLDSGSRFWCVVSNANGSSKSSEALLKVFDSDQPPVIINQPTDITIAKGEKARFSVGAEGTNLSYQWQRFGVIIVGATSFMYETPIVVDSNNGDKFMCKVSNPSASLMTKEVTLTINNIDQSEKPQIIQHPIDVQVTEGGEATFSVGALGKGLKYQWKRNQEEIKGATTQTYRLSPVLMNDNNGKFSCVVSNALGSVESREATLIVVATIHPPKIINQPVNKTVKKGETATFSIEATGTNLAYQWQKAGVDITGATGSSYTTPSLEKTDNNIQLRCIVKNSVATIESQIAILTVQWIPELSKTTPPNMTLKEGELVVLTATVLDAGNPKSSYEWKSSDGQSIGSNEKCSFTATKQDNGKQFYCIASNIIGTSESARVTLAVQWPPTNLTISPGLIEGNDGELVTISAQSSDANPSAQYQWIVDGQTLKNSSKDVPLKLVKDYNGKIISCKAFNISGESQVVSRNITVYWIGTLSISNNSGKTTFYEGDQMSFTASLTDWNPIPSDQNVVWTYDKNYTGRNLNTVTVIGKTQIRCVASNKVGICTPWNANITVNKKVEAPQSVQLNVDKTNVTVGEKVTFTCTIYGGTPPFDIEWIGSGISGTEKVSSFKSTKIVPVTMDMNGKQFRCKVKNLAASLGLESNEIKLTIIEENNSPKWAAIPDYHQSAVAFDYTIFNLKTYCEDEHPDNLKFSMKTTGWFISVKENGDVVARSKAVAVPGNYISTFLADDGKYQIESPEFHFIVDENSARFNIIKK